jgi:hypothetical protein
MSAGYEHAPMETFLRQIAYAKNAAHQRFLENFNGKLKGRGNIRFLVTIEFLGGVQLRKDIERELGNPTYQPEEWYPARDAIVMFDRAFRAGLPMERLGYRAMPFIKQAFPALFQGKTLRDAFAILEDTYRDNTTYGGIEPGKLVEPTRALFYRKGSPFPCDYFAGVINGLLSLFSIEATTREIACQWDGAAACLYESTWAG